MLIFEVTWLFIYCFTLQADLKDNYETLQKRINSLEELRKEDAQLIQQLSNSVCMLMLYYLTN